MTTEYEELYKQSMLGLKAINERRLPMLVTDFTSLTLSKTKQFYRNKYGVDPIPVATVFRLPVEFLINMNWENLLGLFSLLRREMGEGNSIYVGEDTADGGAILLSNVNPVDEANTTVVYTGISEDGESFFETQILKDIIPAECWDDQFENGIQIDPSFENFRHWLWLNCEMFRPEITMEIHYLLDEFWRD